jgi:hypothetical protein
MKTVSNPSKHQGFSEWNQQSVNKDDDNKGFLTGLSGNFQCLYGTLNEVKFFFPNRTDLEDIMETWILSIPLIKNKTDKSDLI